MASQPVPVEGAAPVVPHPVVDIPADRSAEKRAQFAARIIPRSGEKTKAYKNSKILKAVALTSAVLLAALLVLFLLVSNPIGWIASANGGCPYLKGEILNRAKQAGEGNPLSSRKPIG